MKRFEYYVRDAAYDNMARDKELENKRLTRNQRRQNRKKVAYFSFLILLLFSLVLLLCTSVVEHRTLKDDQAQNVKFGFEEVLSGNQSKYTTQKALSYQKPNAENGRLPGDDIPASGYASMEAYEVANASNVKSATFKVTYYCGCSKCCGKWSGGSESEAYGCRGDKLEPGVSIAADPNILPYGTTITDGCGSYFVVQDTGSAIKGNRIDIFTGDHQKALELGVKEQIFYWSV